MGLNQRSERNLAGVHEDLVGIVREAAERVGKKHPHLGFIVTEGLRTRERQEKLVASGASRTMNSRHLTGHAVDLAATVDGDVRWDWPLYSKLAEVMMEVAGERNIPLIWGGTWRTLRDGPHFELDRRKYP